jgi:hypothetical protein
MERTMTFVLARRQLYDLVWSEPIQRLSKQIGISDVAIAKQCHKHGVPVPPRGYWNRRQAGKRVRKKKLPERNLVTIDRVSMSGTLPPELHERLNRVPGEASETIDVLTARLRERLGLVKVPRNFSRVHRCIATLLERDEESRQKHGSSVFTKFGAPSERRRLLFLNGLFLGFEKVGGRAWLRGEYAREHGIYMGNSMIQFTLGTSSNGRNGHARSYPVAAIPDALYLSVFGYGFPPGLATRWQDEEGNPLENQLTEVIVGLAVGHQHRHFVTEKLAAGR